MRVSARTHPEDVVPGMATDLKVILDITTVQRFWICVDKSPGFGPNGDCWKWTGIKFKTGSPYGVMTISFVIPGIGRVRATRLAHRTSFLIHNGYLSDLDVCHSCDNPECVNPSHLWEGTKRRIWLIEISSVETVSPRGHIVTVVMSLGRTLNEITGAHAYVPPVYRRIDVSGEQGEKL